MKLDTMVVGVDGSPNSLAAVTWAAGMAALSGARVVAVHSLGLLDRLRPDDEPVASSSHRDEIGEALRTVWCAPLLDAGVEHTCELRDGNPVTVLLATADEVGADLIVVGSRGLGGFPELLLGSTSTQVAQHASVPVTIIPAPGT